MELEHIIRDLVLVQIRELDLDPRDRVPINHTGDTRPPTVSANLTRHPEIQHTRHRTPFSIQAGNLPSVLQSFPCQRCGGAAYCRLIFFLRP